MAGEDLAGGEVDDGDVVVVGEREDAFAGVLCADAEVVHSSGASEGHSAVGVEAVVAQAVVRWGVAGGGGGFGGGAVGVAGGAACERAVGAVFVVVLAELVELALQFGRASGLAVGRRSQRCRVWWKRSILPWVCGCPGEPFFWRTPSSGSRYSKALRPPPKRAV